MKIALFYGFFCLGVFFILCLWNPLAKTQDMVRMAIGFPMLFVIGFLLGLWIENKDVEDKVKKRWE